MKITATAVAGTLESSDAFVTAEPAQALEIEIQSVVYQQFGEQIRQSILDVVKALGVESGRIIVNDRGAIDCVIKARVETALRRAEGGRT